MDLDQTQAFGEYVSRLPSLKHLKFSSKSAKEFLAKKQVGDKVYVDIRCYSTEWYHSVLTFLTDRYDKLNVVIYEVVAVTTRAIKAYFPTYDERWEASTGSCKLGSRVYAVASHVPRSTYVVRGTDRDSKTLYAYESYVHVPTSV